MKVLHLHPGDDTGGKSMAAKKALEAAGDSVRVFIGPGSMGGYFDYPPAEPWDQEAVEEAWDWADLVVLHNEPALLMTRLSVPCERPLMVHHHGSILRRGGLAKWAEGDRLGAVQVVSSVDLLAGLPDTVRWLPQIVDLAEMARIREAEYRPTPQMRVTHAPTSRQAKGTRVIVTACRKLRLLIQWDLIQRKPWAECLRRKARSDLYLDQMTFGYGANGVEAWGMGLPVIGGAYPAVLERMRDMWGELPFYLTEWDREALIGHLRAFAADADLRAEWARRGLAHAQRFHDLPAFTARFRELAGRAMGVTKAAA